MPRRKFIDKKTSTTYALVHRAQNDPLIHDEDAPSMVFAEKAAPRRPREDDYAYSSSGSVVSSDSAVARSSKRTRERGDLEDEFGLSVRQNEGEAAQHGVFFDDSGYDYMQHMRDLGSGSGDGGVTWVEASAQKDKAKGKERLEDALKSLDFEDTRSIGTASTTASSTRSLFPEEMFGSEFVRRRTYQDQQDVPDEIAGLQPDMDPALREVLEALDDEAYVDDEDDEDFFAQLTGGGEEVEKEEWERIVEQGVWEDVDEDDAGWESESTVRASSPPPAVVAGDDREPPPALEITEGEQAKPPEDVQAVPPADPTDGAWLDEFKKFQTASKSASKGPAATHPPAAAPPSALQSSVLSSLATGPKKKRKGARTTPSTSSMTSSVLSRTAHQTLLDSRFDRLEAAYEADEDPSFDDTASGVTGFSAASGVSKASGVSSYSRASDVGAPKAERGDFDAIMDDFLGGYSKSSGGRRGKKGGGSGGPGGGLQQLDEVRQGLGPARVRSKAVS